MVLRAFGSSCLFERSNFPLHLPHYSPSLRNVDSGINAFGNARDRDSHFSRLEPSAHKSLRTAGSKALTKSRCKAYKGNGNSYQRVFAGLPQHPQKVSPILLNIGRLSPRREYGTDVAEVISTATAVLDWSVVRTLFSLTSVQEQVSCELVERIYV